MWPRQVRTSSLGQRTPNRAQGWPPSPVTCISANCPVSQRFKGHSFSTCISPLPVPTPLPAPALVQPPSCGCRFPNSSGSCPLCLCCQPSIPGSPVRAPHCKAAEPCWAVEICLCLVPCPEIPGFPLLLPEVPMLLAVCGGPSLILLQDFHCLPLRTFLCPRTVLCSPRLQSAWTALSQEACLGHPERGTVHP